MVTIEQISDTWQLTSLDVGWGPVGGIGVTMYAGSFAVPVNDVRSGNWSDPTTWSLSNVVVLYDRAKTMNDILTGQDWVDASQGSASFAWQGLTGGLGPTEQSVTFPIPLLDYSPVVNVNVGTTLQYNVTISNSITLDQNATLNSLSVAAGGQLNCQPGTSLVLRSGNSQNAGTITGANVTVQSGASLTNLGSLEWSGGSIIGSGGLTNQGSLTINPTSATSLFGTLTNSGTITQTTNGVLGIGGGAAVLNNLAGAVYTIQGSGQIDEGSGGPGTINNAGLFVKSGTGTASIYANTAFNNTGTVEVDSGTLALSNFTQTAGLTNLNGGNLTFSSPAQILGGQLLGSGTISGSIVNTGGLLSPGHSAGSIIINGNYTEGPAGTLLVELGGLGNGQFDYLDVNGTASLGGTLEIAFLNGFNPAVGDTFHIMDFTSLTGDFASIQVLGASGYQFSEEFTGGGLTLVTQAVPEPSMFVLMGIGALGLLAYACRRQKRTA